MLIFLIIMQFFESCFVIREPKSHSNQCDLIEQSSALMNHYRIVYGIFNSGSSMDSLQFFKVSRGTLLPDILHDILEGMLPLEVKLMLQVSLIL